MMTAAKTDMKAAADDNLKHHVDDDDDVVQLTAAANKHDDLQDHAEDNGKMLAVDAAILYIRKYDFDTDFCVAANHHDHTDDIDGNDVMTMAAKTAAEEALGITPAPTPNVAVMEDNDDKNVDDVAVSHIIDDGILYFFEYDFAPDFVLDTACMLDVPLKTTSLISCRPSPPNCPPVPADHQDKTKKAAAETANNKADDNDEEHHDVHNHDADYEHCDAATDALHNSEDATDTMINMMTTDDRRLDDHLCCGSR